MSVDTVYLLTLTVTSVERRTTTTRDYDSSQSGTAAGMSGNTVTFVNIHRVLQKHHTSKSIIIYAVMQVTTLPHIGLKCNIIPSVGT